MRKLSLFLMIALLGAMTCLTGCAAKATAAASPSANYGPPTPSGMKSPSQVQACCRPLAEGRISLAQCMANPQCVANGNRCCMNSF